MKFIKYFSLIILAVVTACSTDPAIPATEDELKGLTLIQILENSEHSVELFSSTGSLEQGYNLIRLRLKDKQTGTYIKDASIEWTPVMNMISKQHSAPRSQVTKIDTENLYGGYIVFQISQNDDEKWSLTLDYKVGERHFTIKDGIEVPPSTRRRVAVFTGSNQAKYALFLVRPEAPKMAANEMVVGLAIMEGPFEFTGAGHHRIIIDPRMPGMGNHSSPNNDILLRQPGDEFYRGTLNLTMSGYWKINMQVEDPEGTIIKGEPVTDEHPASSLFLELEF